MKNEKLEKPPEKDIKLKKEEINQIELEEKFETKVKNTNNKRKEKRRKYKKYKIDEQILEMNTDKIVFQEYKNILRKDLNYKGNKINIKKLYKNNNNKGNRINIKKNICIIIMISFNLIISNNNNITLKIQGPGFSNILGPSNQFSSSHYPNIIYINGNPNYTITNRYYFNEMNNIVNLIWNNSIDNCQYMFDGCSNITEIDLSNFDASKVINMYTMFHKCSQLTSLNLSNFNTSKVTNMGYMFYGCSQLTSLNLSNFNTSNVENMNSMFSDCSKLISLNLSNFVTSKVRDMHYMFYRCSQLTLLNLSNFDTSQVTDMKCMFSDCSKLEYINLKNFIEKNTLTFENIFYNIPNNIVACLNENSHKISVALINRSCYTLDCSDYWKINQKKLVNKTDICFDISNNNISYNYEYQGIYYENCINGNLTNNKTINYCKCDIEKCLYCPNMSLIDDLCVDCNNGYYEIENDNDTYGYKKCYKDPIAYYLDRNESIYKKCYYTCEKCEMKGDNIAHNCKECNNNYPIGIKINNYFNCYNCSYYYYFDNYNNIHCTDNYTCPNEYPMLDKLECKKRNEIKTITNYLINDLDDKETKEEEIIAYDTILKNIEDIYTSKYYDTTNIDKGNDEIIDIKKIKVILTTSLNQKNNINSNMANIDLGELEYKKRNEIKTIINYLINDLDDKETKEEEIIAYDTILKNIEDIYISKYYDTTNIDKGNDEIIDIKKIKVILTTSQNLKNNINSNMTNIDLGECENSLRQFYNISNDTKIYIKMLEISQEGMRIPKVEYDIYSKLNGENLIKLNISTCKNNKISLSIPINNVDNIDILNSSSGYYNDFCYTATSDSGTDITLRDRKDEYPSKAVCQNDCDFVNYNYTIKKSKCSCLPKKTSSSFADMNIDKKKLLDNFKNIKNIANIRILKCLKVLFNKLDISNNVGFFVLISIIIFHTIILIIFYLKNLDLLIYKIKQLIIVLKYLKQKNKEEKEIKEEKKEKIEDIIKIEVKKKKEKEVENNRIKINEIDDSNDKLNINSDNISNELVEGDKKLKIKENYIKKNNFIKKEKEDNNNNEEKNNIININLNIKNIITDGNNENKIESLNISKKDNIKNLTPMMDYTEDEINDLSYDLALKNDKRTYWQFYISLIKTKHELIYTFFFDKDYNSKIIKIDLFIFGFALNYAINGLFFNDDTMHNVYENKGLFDVSYQLPLIIYSSFISMFLGSLVQMLGLSNDAIIDFKQSKEINNINERGEKIIKKIKIKFIFYFILSFLLLFCFCYYISMFDAVYRNTQFLLLEDTLIGFGLSLVTPFVLYLIPGMFRIPALRAPQNKRYLYNFSKLFTIL